MINCHSSIVSPPESGFLHWWKEKYLHWQWDAISGARLDEFIVDLKSSRKIETWNLNYGDLIKLIVSKKPNSYAELMEMIYVFYGFSQGKDPSIIVDKNNYYIHHLADLKEVWPDAYFIQMVRDGRDVACSYRELRHLDTKSIYKPKLSDSIEEIAMEWTTNNRNVLDFILSLHDQRRILIRYEDLILNTEKTLQSVCLFLGIQYERNMLNYHDERNHDEPKETIDWKRKTLDPPDPSRIGRFKSDLTEGEINIFNSIAGSVLLQFNYSIS